MGVHDVGRYDENGVFVVFEYVEGRNLADLLDSERLSPTEIATLLIPIADAAHHAHRAGLVHRDLKPSNISDRCRSVARTSPISAWRSVRSLQDLRVGEDCRDASLHVTRASAGREPSPGRANGCLGHRSDALSLPAGPPAVFGPGPQSRSSTRSCIAIPSLPARSTTRFRASWSESASNACRGAWPIGMKLRRTWPTI